MAATYQSISTTNLSGTGGGSAAHSLVVTKPSGLTAGDEMLAWVATGANNDIDTASEGSDDTMSAAGWTKIGGASKSDQSPDSFIAIYRKTATAGDAAATNFTLFNRSGGVSNNFGGGIIRFSSDSVVSSAYTYSDFDTTEDTNPTTVTVSGGVTPSIADNILVMIGMLASSDNSNVLSVSNYAVTTSNPTWTERVDNTRLTDGEAHVQFVATGPRSATTATGNYSFDVAGDGPSDAIFGAVCLLTVQTVTNVSVSPSVISMTSSVQSPTVAANANVTVGSAISLTSSVQSPTVSGSAAPWVNLPKS
jgi:hypothetical protein